MDFEDPTEWFFSRVGCINRSTSNYLFCRKLQSTPPYSAQYQVFTIPVFQADLVIVQVSFVKPTMHEITSLRGVVPVALMTHNEERLETYTTSINKPARSSMYCLTIFHYN